MRAWILSSLVILPLALLGARWAVQHESPPKTGALAESSVGPSPALELADTSSEVAGANRHVPEGTLRHEPLERPPRELVVKILLGDSEDAVEGAEVFALERDDYEWYSALPGECSPVPDLEALARTQGRKLECDAEGRVHLALPQRVVFLCARKGELFGAGQFDATDAPEDELQLAPSYDTRVLVTGPSGEPLAGIPVVIGRQGLVWWRMNTGTNGEARVPNAPWLVADSRSSGDPWFVAVEEASSAPVLRSFAWDEPIPREIELRLPRACALSIGVQASDGTPVPLRGTVRVDCVTGHGRSLAVRFGTELYPEYALREGRALVARAEPGSTLVVDADLEGYFDCSESVRVPDLDLAEISLRLPVEAQVLLFRAVDASGAPLALRRLKWLTYDEQPGGPTRLDAGETELHTDELGRGCLVLDRKDLESPELDPDEEPPPVRIHRAILSFTEGGTHLASAVLDLGAIAPGSVRDLGALRLEPMPLLARGRVLDDEGAPLANAWVSLQHLQEIDGEEEREDLTGVEVQPTGADGRFEFHGPRPSGRLRLLVDRDGYVLPEGASVPVFDCGASPELDLVLARTGILRASVLADASLGAIYTWVLHGPSGEERDSLYQNQGPGELESEFWGLRPGHYRIELVTGYPLDAPLAAFDDVVVLPGMRTLDPRLLRVPLHVEGARGIAQEAQARAPRAELPKIRIEVADSSGRLLEQGMYITWGGCSWSQSHFRDGTFELDADMAGRRFGLWAPGQSYREVTCPERSERIVLQPALRASVHVEVPDVLRRAGAFVSVDVLDREDDESARWLPDLVGSAELDERGEVRFECAAPGRMRLGLHAVQLDPSGPQRRAEAALEGDDEFWIRVVDVPGEQRFEFAPPAAVWAALARDLAQSR